MASVSKESGRRATAGIDIGSTATKAVVLRGEEVLGRALLPTGWSPREAGEEALLRALASAGVERAELAAVVGTGYGRISLSFLDRRVTEITCHARGARHFLPDCRSVVDIGGQDLKAIALAPDGSVADFAMNDKCAAGTGRFLQVMAGALDMTLDELGDAAAEAEPESITSMCAVFAETEVIGLLAGGADKRRVAAGIVRSVAGRIRALSGRSPLTAPCVFTGGLARHPAIRSLLARELGMELITPTEPQLAGALGAALIAAELAD